MIQRNTLLVTTIMLVSLSLPAVACSAPHLGPELDLKTLPLARVAGDVSGKGRAATFVEEITLSIDPMHLRIETTVDGDDAVLLAGSGRSAAPGEPDLPIRTFFVPSVERRRLRAVEVIGGTYRTIEGALSVAPAREPVFWSAGGSVRRPDLGIYNVHRYFPGRLLSFEQSSGVNGCGALLRVHPVQYLPPTGETQLVTRVLVRLHWETVETRRWKGGARITTDSVVVCPEAFASSAHLLSSLHEAWGVTCEVLTTESIDGSVELAGHPPVSGYHDDLPGKENIEGYDYELARKIIRYLDENGGETLRYVTILGDTLAVPPSYYFCHLHLTNYENWIPTDFFYASPDYTNEVDWGVNWSVGRLPAANADQADVLVAKIERWIAALDDTWFRNVALGGARPLDTRFLYGELICMDGLNRDLFGGMAAAKYFHSHETYDRDVIEPVFESGGSGFAFFIAHGSGKAMVFDSDPESPARITGRQLLGYAPVDTLPVIMSVACGAAAFDDELMTNAPYGPPSFGEAVLFSDAGGIAYVGAARSSIGVPEIYLDEGRVQIGFEAHMPGMLLGLFETYQASEAAPHLGDLVVGAFTRFVQANDMGGDPWNEVTLFETVLLGDPALPLPARAEHAFCETPMLEAVEPTGTEADGTAYYAIPESGRAVAVAIESDAAAVELRAFSVSDDGPVYEAVYGSGPISHEREYTRDEGGFHMVAASVKTGPEEDDFTKEARLYFVACWDDDGDGATDESCGGGDCDDGDSAIHPAAAEHAGDGVDSNCNGSDNCFVATVGR